MFQKLKVTIIGAGLAGTICARVLRECHDVTILEHFSGGHEVGAAINLGPTATKIVQGLGFDMKRSGSIEVGSTRTFDQAGNLLLDRDVSDCKAVYGAAWIFQHTADLWNEFLRLATTPSVILGVAGAPAKILWGVDVTHVDVDSGDVTLGDGSVITSDLVISRPVPYLGRQVDDSKIQVGFLVHDNENLLSASQKGQPRPTAISSFLQ